MCYREVGFFMKKLKSFEALSDEEAKLIIGGGHCYTAGCIRRRDKPRNSDSFFPGLAHGICQGGGICG